MHNRKLTLERLEHGHSRKAFLHLQNIAGLQEHGKGRVDDAMKAAIAHVQKKRNLQLGITDKHVDMALGYLKNHYEGRKLLKAKEKEVIQHSLDMFFGKKSGESIEKEKKVEKEVTPVARITRPPQDITPKLSEVSPQAATNDSEYRETA